MRPLFIFSLPRTGSTLAQRILAAHHDIATVAEPWILLPHLCTLRDCGIYIQTAVPGTNQYQSLSQEPLSKWRRTLSNPLRKAWCRRYLRWIGADRLTVMGYDQKALLIELAQTPTSLTGLARDCLDSLCGAVHCGLDPAIVKDRLRQLPDWHEIRGHS